MSWWMWLLLWIAISFPVAVFVGHWIRGSYSGDRYWRWRW